MTSDKHGRRQIQEQQASANDSCYYSLDYYQKMNSLNPLSSTLEFWGVMPRNLHAELTPAITYVFSVLSGKTFRASYCSFDSHKLTHTSIQFCEATEMSKRMT